MKSYIAVVKPDGETDCIVRSNETATKIVMASKLPLTIKTVFLMESCDEWRQIRQQAGVFLDGDELGKVPH